MNRYEYISDKKKYAKELIDIMNLYKEISFAIDEHVRLMREALTKGGMRSELVTRFEGMIKDKFNDSVEGGELHTMLIRHYEQALNQDEMIALIEFYKDEKTKRMAAVIKTLSDATLNMSKEYMERKSKELDIEVKKVMEEEKTRIARETPLGRSLYGGMLGNPIPADNINDVE